MTVADAEPRSATQELEGAAAEFAALSYDAKVTNEHRFDQKISHMERLWEATSNLHELLSKDFTQTMSEGFKFQVAPNTVASVEFKGERPTAAAIRALIAHLRLMEASFKEVSPA